MKVWLFCCLLIPTLAFCGIEDEFQHLKSKPEQLTQFIAAMPKGGELHLHLAGGVTPFYLLDLARSGQYHFCEQERICAQGDSAEHYLINPLHVHQVVNAWSMPDTLQDETGHDHFFATFLKFWPIVFDHRGAVLAQLLRDAERQHIHYLEVMILADNNRASALSEGLPWTGDLNAYRKQLIKKGLLEIVASLPGYLDQLEAEAHRLLGCAQQDRPACHIPVRYQAIALREQSPGSVFAAMMASFELALREARVVGVNLVQAEDGVIALRDYHLQMKMLDHLHQLYPRVNLSLHAGELSKHGTAAQDLTFHVTEAITLGHAQRIGHGVSVLYEKGLPKLLKLIKARDILFEINLTSNHKILNLHPKQHPLSWLLRHGVAVSLSTDDPGVLGTDLNREYELAVVSQNLTYRTLRHVNRNSLQYSFLPGQPLWRSVQHEIKNPACQNARASASPSKKCQQFLNTSPKAKLQWQFEQALWRFEQNWMKNVTKRVPRPFGVNG